MKKHIANIITGSRIVLSLPLLFVPLSSAWFYALYLLCGLSDMVDGTVARMMGGASEFGARLDTVSDFVFMSVALIKFVPHFHIPVWLWIWIGVIAMMKLGNAASGFVMGESTVNLLLTILPLKKKALENVMFPMLFYYFVDFFIGSTSPRRAAASSRILYLRIFPAAFIGQLDTNSMYFGTL